MGDRVDLLDEGCKLVQGLLLEEAFPGQAGEGKVDAVAVDVSSGRVRRLGAFLNDRLDADSPSDRSRLSHGDG